MVIAQHVVPRDDLVEHLTSEDCSCGPAPMLVVTNGGDGWVLIHHSLDGRESGE